MGVLICCDCFFYRKSKGKPNGKKPPTEEKKQYLEVEYTKVRVVDFDLKELVVLPREIDLNEWLASNTTTFFNLINLQYSTISEFCTGDTCQAMTACNTVYYWYDEKGKKTKCTAPQYVDFVMSLVQKLVTDEDIFPTKYGKEFPNAFETLVKKICRYLFHVLAHIYWSHYRESVAMDLHGHLNTLYTHFIVFIREFNLVDPKETSIMDDLSEVLCTPLPPRTEPRHREMNRAPGARLPSRRRRRTPEDEGQSAPPAPRLARGREGDSETFHSPTHLLSLGPCQQTGLAGQQETL
ncbi:MOB kinase activator 2-like isoform X3 [Alosa sapidissima]|uniref:MOB kinase activator 2-like isoform X3 n=1 Tax=Alosa sapidissima TaxID=34773 RepID=UPI001C091F47|nr:MOB kinase activator 2-like isoform X3 [Alosa sapidissima]